VLLDELKSEDQVKRINSVNSLSTIAIALGPDRTRSELLPYILELLDDESEVLAELAIVLGKMLDVVGGPQFADHLFRILERLCLIEETVVRDKAIGALKTLFKHVSLKDYQNSIMQMLDRLIHSDCVAAKLSAVSIIPSVIPHFSQIN